MFFIVFNKRYIIYRSILVLDSRDFKIITRARKITLFAAAHETGFSRCPFGHCSFPPRLRRLVHENLAALRFSVRNLVLFLITARKSKNHTFCSCPQFADTSAHRRGARNIKINNSRKENHTFSQRTLVCKNFCFCRKGEAARLKICVPPKQTGPPKIATRVAV